MKKWSNETEIEAPIEQVWKLFNSSLEEMQKIMPQVIGHEPVKVTPEGTGSIFRQKYKEGKRVEEYDVETLEYLNTPDTKKLKVGFVLANLFEITALYELAKVNENKISFSYTATNTALKWYAKIFLLFANKKTVVSFVEKVKQTAEAEHKR